jgi:hypothetical protein
MPAEFFTGTSNATSQGFGVLSLDIYGLFITQFPEFINVPKGQVNVYLNNAFLEIDQTVWGATAQQGQFYLAAHRLATSPFGQNAKMVTYPLAQGYKRTVYGHTYKELQIQPSSGFRIT